VGGRAAMAPWPAAAKDQVSAVGIAGTPGYVIGNDVILGAVSIAGRKRRIETVRGAKVH
jgi:hypothetical protein